MSQLPDRIRITRIERFSQRLKKRILPERMPLMIHYAPCDGETRFEDVRALSFRPLQIGEVWGKHWEVGWFRLEGEVPPRWNGCTVAARIDVAGEGLVHTSDGTMIQGVTAGSVFDSDFSRDTVRLFDRCDGGEKVELWVEATAAGLFGMFTEADPAHDAPIRYGQFEASLRAAELCLFDVDIWSLWLDVELILGLIRATSEPSVRRARLIEGVDKLIDAHSVGAAPLSCRAMLDEILGNRAEASALNVTAVGHAHIDTAWLWPVRESVRKCARTFATQLALIDRYPDYLFGASQPQHYAFVREHYPALYERIKAAVSEGRWELQGAMWVEADCNLIGGESMVRQIIHGKNFYRDEFGVDVDNLWLPDVFGYSAALPQMLARSGVRYFLTQKMSWNQVNKFPHHTFQWEGIDGSRVLTHFPPEDTYNSTLRPESLMAAAGRFAQRGKLDGFISLFGVGDGGGGPKEEHIEMGRRQTDLEGTPRVAFGRASDFFAEIERHRDRLPIWVGELYLELHRGTLTTQARLKRLNRKLESKLHAVEMLWSCLPLEHYPSEALDRLWKTLLKNQFHDILPGSSITKVYREAEAELQSVDAALDSLSMQAVQRLFEEDDSALVLFNPNGSTSHVPVELPAGWLGATSGDDGKNLPVQRETDGVVVDVAVEPFMFLTLCRSESTPDEAATFEDAVLENDLVRYEFAPDGRLLRGYDKEAQRAFTVDDRPGNCLTLYDDHPNDWDAWDIDLFYENTPIESQRCIGTHVLERGSVRQQMRLRMTIGDSSIEQRVILSAHSKRLDFITCVDWREAHKMLRVAFPVRIRATEAAFDIQYGYLKRPTHRNSSWDAARFEVVGHKYADLSEPDYGVALLNDCKYGYKVHGDTLDLCLLRSPTYPDPDADRGKHHFTYSLLPHCGDLVRSNVQSEAEALNRPLNVFEGWRSVGARTPVRVIDSKVRLAVIKKAERDDSLVIRLVESSGCESKATLSIDETFQVLEECDLLEWTTLSHTEVSGSVDVTLRPFEIRTYRLKRR